MTVSFATGFRKIRLASLSRPARSTVAVVAVAAGLAVAVTAAMISLGLVATRGAGVSAAQTVWSLVAAYSLGVCGLAAAAAWAVLRLLASQSRRIAELLEGHPAQNAARARQAAAARYAASLSPHNQIMELGAELPQPRPSLVLVADASAATPDRGAAGRR